MKICWDNLEGVRLTVHGNFRLYSHTYIEMDSCKSCGEPYLARTDGPSLFCDRFCANMGKNNSMYDRGHTLESRKKISKSIRGKNHPMYGKHHTIEVRKKISKHNISKHVGSLNPSWKGGVRKKDLPLYDTYVQQINYAHETNLVIKEELRLLEVRCKNCNGWFIPKATNVRKRIRSLLGKDGGESNFYCSDECRDSCSIFAQQKWPKNHKPRKVNKSIWYTDAELRVWREEVLKRADYKCEYCGKKATIAHHSKPKKLEPFFALDPDYGVACCEKCHYKYGHNGECNTANLARIDCK